MFVCSKEDVINGRTFDFVVDVKLTVNILLGICFRQIIPKLFRNLKEGHIYKRQNTIANIVIHAKLCLFVVKRTLLMPEHLIL